MQQRQCVGRDEFVPHFLSGVWAQDAAEEWHRSHSNFQAWAMGFIGFPHGRAAADGEILAQGVIDAGVEFGAAAHILGQRLGLGAALLVLLK